MPDVKALLFDTFGTIVDWRGSLIADFTAWGEARGLTVDWAALVDAWRSAYRPSMDEVRSHPERGFLTLDELQRQSVEPLAARLGITGLSRDDFDHLTLGWHRLKPWPDSVPGLTRLKTKFVISPLSNGNVALMTNLAKYAGLPWDVILCAEIFQRYKPDPEVYLGAAKLLGLRPEQVMLVAAHNYDLIAARACGLKTCFVPRIAEYGPHQKEDFEATSDWDFVVADIEDLASRLGC
ncbi:haloacid dehalogenase type II [Afipia felis]|uniref:(S)-2-haloacid dehalogenase 4A n=2 Tax=Afipia felis TaxID=1035 RepID=A0A380W8A6_AFIFE|nr:haloacid dehalogenase type II [Afipia felis]EKS28424.1 haloacid dehalogenase, type II [Afipia felis ATCC 53690]SUU77133.1 (S)-2-haloacid dehalogenase 4A [Afipia felis]SUU85200.1 (S)-2-haloacid dehalogenase 4A [Afipia felis]